MNMSPARMSAYTSRLAGLGDFWDYLTVADTGYESLPEQLSGPLPGDIVTGLPSSMPSGGVDWNKVLQTGKDFVIGLTQADMQRRVFDMNVERARRGLAPISASSVSPSVGVSVGMQPDTKRLLVLAGGGLVAAYLVGQMLKRRR